MVKDYFKVLLVFCFYVAISAYVANAQTTITEWNFDNETLVPSYGPGTAETTGETSSAFASGDPNGRAWNTASYPPQGTGSGTAGVQFSVSTTGFNNISLSWTNRMSNTAANRIRLQYTINGTDWINFTASEENASNTRDGNEVGFDNGTYIADTGTVWFSRSADLSTITGVNNNPLFALRLVTEFVDGSVYGAATTTSSYGTSGTVRFDNVIFTGTTATNPLITASPEILSGFTYIEGQGPSASQIYTLSGMDLEGSGYIVVTGSINYEVSLNGADYAASVEVPFAGGQVTGQPVNIWVRLRVGLPMGDYNNQVITNNGGDAPEATVIVSGSVTTSAIPGISNVLLPQFIEGLNATNVNRVPFAYRATLSCLTPNATYRYYNKVVVETDAPDFNGAGYTIFANADGTFTRTTQTSLDTPGQYGEFTTDATGRWSGWFMTEPSGNDRFTPGNRLYMRININDGNGGTTEDQRFTTAEYARVLQFGTENVATQGTAIRAISYDGAGDFVFFYSETSDTLRPLYGTQIESTAIDFCTTGVYAPFYCDYVAGNNGSWGGIIPNMNPDGVQMIRVLANDGGNVVEEYVIDSGIWLGTDTRNPSGGVDSVLFINLQIIGINNHDVAIAKIWSRNHEIVIEPATSGNHTFSIYTLSGSKSGSYMINGNQSINVNLPSGIYIGQLQNATGVMTVKVYIK